MTVVALVRHGLTDAVEQHSIAGRVAHAPLNARGSRQAEELAERLAPARPAAVYASPLTRARETAAPLAARLGLPVLIDDGLLEIDFGEWSGHAVDTLRERADWSAFHANRTTTRIPAGEMLVEAQARIVVALERLRAAHPDGRIVAVSHADPIRLALAHCLGAPIELMLRLEVGPASVSVVQLESWGVKVWGINHQGVQPL
jgi:broad specificity phosphatase PhoE